MSLEEKFLKESNAIEGVYDADSLQQAIYAWEYLKEQDKIDPHVISKTHKILMLNQPIYPNEKGYFRVVPVFIGGRPGMQWEKIGLAIADWCLDMNTPFNLTDEHKENVSQELHVQYEKIHPFIDGNGRTGRMFMNWWRMKNGLPLLVIHEGKEQMEYYKWFKGKQHD